MTFPNPHVNNNRSRTFFCMLTTVSTQKNVLVVNSRVTSYNKTPQKKKVSKKKEKKKSLVKKRKLF